MRRIVPILLTLLLAGCAVSTTPDVRLSGPCAPNFVKLGLNF